MKVDFADEDIDIEKKHKKKPSKLSPKSVFWAVFIVIVLILAIILVDKLGKASDNGDSIPAMLEDAVIGEEGKVTNVISEGEIRELLEVSDLSTIDYTYNSIVKVYTEDDKHELKYSICYNGTITAGIDFNEIGVKVDEENKLITITIPNAKIQNTTVDLGSLDYIFEKEKYNTETVASEAYSYAENDLKSKASSNEDILVLAKENAASATEALLKPWINELAKEYTVNII